MAAIDNTMRFVLAPIRVMVPPKRAAKLSGNNNFEGAIFTYIYEQQIHQKEFTNLYNHNHKVKNREPSLLVLQV